LVAPRPPARSPTDVQNGFYNSNLIQSKALINSTAVLC
jgi:hypothetical protein